MKRVKRLFACLLALTMMLGLSATAFAATKQETTNGGTVQFTKAYKLEGEGTSPAETFDFTIEKTGDVVDGGTGSESQELPTIQSGATFIENAATTGGAQVDATVKLPEYNAVGTYSYTIREQAGTTAGVTYDDSTVTMKVTVINGDTDGTYKINGVTFWKDGEKIDTGNAGGVKNDAAFSNTYTANKLNITKTVAGNLGDKFKYFDFTVTLTGEEGKTYTLPATITGGSDGSEKKESVTISGNTTFKLKHKDTITIENLPAGVTYKVEEAAVTGYETTSKDADGTMNATAKTATFTNTKGGDIDTGVYLDNLPYLLVFAGVLAIAAVFVVRRRRFED